MWSVMLISLASCSPQRRFTRLIKKHPELIQTDTIVRIDTVKVLVPKIEHDTAFIESMLYDTVRIEKERLRIKIWKEYDTIHVQGVCDTLTITEYIETKVPVHYYEKSKNYVWIVILMVVIFIAYLFITKSKEK